MAFSNKPSNLPTPKITMPQTQATPMAAAKPVTPPLPKSPNWVDKMGTAIMRGEMRSGAQHAEQSQKMIQQVQSEAGENKPLKPTMPKIQKAPKSAVGTPEKPVKVHSDYKMGKQTPSKNKLPDSIVPPPGVNPEDIG